MRSLSNQKPSYTLGEVRGLLAPVFNLAAEDIEDFCIMVTAPCPRCGISHDVQIVDSALSFDEAMRMFSHGITVAVDSFIGEEESE